MNCTPEKANWTESAHHTARSRPAAAWEWLRENLLFSVFFAGMSVYYLWRLFAIPPWYDELYTYQMFIDRGMIYSMIHWPLPNNHVFFSALSAILNGLGNPWLGLRGISFLASLGSLLLLYRILKKGVSAGAAAAGCGLFAAMYNVTLQAVQGRGYALSGFFLLAAVNFLYVICVPILPEAAERSTSGQESYGPEATEENTQEKRRKRRRFVCYAGFAFCLTGGLYTIPSNLYWVVSICLAGGLFLLLHREYGRLLRLVAASAAAAAVTFGLYTIIWLAIGSNFLVKEEEGPFYGMGHVQMILREPLAAFSRGLHAMLSDPNIQSVERRQFMEGILSYLGKMLDQVYPWGAAILTVLLPVCLLAVLFLTVRSLRNGQRAVCFLSMYCVVLTVMAPVFLFVQCVFPYLRVFTWLGSVLAMLFVLAAAAAWEALERRLPAGKGLRQTGGASLRQALPALTAMLLAVACFFLPPYYTGYDSRDNHIHAALEQLDETQVDTVLVGDVYARLNLYFHIERCRNKALVMDYEKPDYVLLDRIQTGPEGTGLIWPYELNTEDLPWDWIGEHMEVVFEDDAYIAWKVKEE